MQKSSNSFFGPSITVNEEVDTPCKKDRYTETTDIYTKGIKPTGFFSDPPDLISLEYLYTKRAKAYYCLNELKLALEDYDQALSCIRKSQEVKDGHIPSLLSLLSLERLLYQRKSELILGPMRNKPACSPIGLHGACGQAFLKKQPLVVSDVKVLGENYVACDPRDQSEIVIPLLDEQNNCWAVLDLDSHDIAAFTAADVEGLINVLQAAQLISHAQEKLTPVFL